LPAAIPTIVAPMRRRTTPAAGFTLVELLIVIGIIAILVGLLLPALNRARQQAVATRCAAQLRDVGAMFHNYAALHRGALPPLNSNLPGTGGEWYFDYLERARLLSGELAGADRAFTQPAVRCPSVDDDAPAVGWGGGYGVNEGHGPDGVIRYAPLGARKMSQFRRSSQLWLIGDVGRRLLASSSADYPWVATFAPPYDPNHVGDNSQRPAPRHRGLVNVCYLDGHVDARAYASLAANEDGVLTP